MSWQEALVLGFVQGATEFLPVSSSGHLVMGQALLGVTLPGAGFEVVVHLATVLSVLIAYWDRVRGLAAGVARRDPVQLRYAALLVLASAPAAVVGVGFGDALESLFDRPAVAGAALVATGGVVWSARWALRREPSRQMGWGAALAMGFAQAAAIVPGISRSGATVVTALWRGVEAREAAAFSFLMSVPAVTGAALLKAGEVLGGGAGAGAGAAGAASGLAGGIGAGVLALAAVTACATGVAAVRLFRAMLDNRSFHVFAPYLWVAGGTFLWWVLR